MRTYETTHQAYLGALRAVVSLGGECGPRGERTTELINDCFTVRRPTDEAIITNDPERDAVVAKYTAAEFALYDSCENRASEFAKHAKMWSRLANPDGTVNSAYGHLLWLRASCGRSKFAKHKPMTPWTWAIHSLKQDRDTRQAFLRFSLPSHQWFGNKDQVCTMHGQFMIRGEALHLTVVMRSNDVVKGLAYDMPWFCSLMPKAIADLKSHYPDLRVGTYTHFAHSLHLYERDREAALRMLGDL